MLLGILVLFKVDFLIRGFWRLWVGAQRSLQHRSGLLLRSKGIHDLQSWGFQV